MGIEENEREEQTGKPISFRAPAALAEAIERAAGRELLSTASYSPRRFNRNGRAKAMPRTDIPMDLGPLGIA
jgi:hypothetical protein